MVVRNDGSQLLFVVGLFYVLYFIITATATA